MDTFSDNLKINKDSWDAASERFFGDRRGGMAC